MLTGFIPIYPKVTLVPIPGRDLSFWGQPTETRTKIHHREINPDQKSSRLFRATMTEEYDGPNLGGVGGWEQDWGRALGGEPALILSEI